MFIWSIIGCLVIGGCGVLKQPSSPDKSQFPKMAMPQAEGSDISENRNTPIARAAKAVGPSIVGITNKAFQRDLFSRPVKVEQGTGSGVIFDPNGYIATNYHVVEGAEELVVSLADGRTLPGKVVGSDPVTDLAVVKIEATGLPAAVLGDSDSSLVGEPAVAIGNPLGLEFQGTVTAGVISALNRSISLGDQEFKLIQTDAAINPGNSGGALINADGLVIGINSAKISAAGVQGMGFAIPINSARPILQSIIDKGRVIRPYLGVGLLDRNAAARYGYNVTNDKGVFVAKVYKDGPAAKAGITEGDIILAVGGKQADNVVDFRTIIDSQAVGSVVPVIIVRNGAQMTISVTFEEMPSPQKIPS
jgi:serine protease Do